MLERATACLKSGAARETLRCAAKAPKSKRRLHSSFWNHGAGDLDLPPWATSMLPMPSDLPLRNDDQSGMHHGLQGGQEQRGQHVGHGLTDGIFLDFLYPQQALALLHRHNAQQSQRWEKRNTRRLPDGFVVASRGYASKSKTAKAKRAAQLEREQVEVEDGDVQEKEEYRPMDNHKQRENGKEHHATTLEETSAHYDGMEESRFGDSPMDLAESSADGAQTLRNIMSFNKKKTGDPKREQHLVNQAWTTYQKLDDAGVDDARLKVEFLSWLNARQTDMSDSYCAELYHSISSGQRTLHVYEVALALFLRRDQHLSASKLHREALENLENGHQISRILFRYSINNGLWRLAIQTEARHRKVYGDSSQTQLFWLHVSEIPQLLSKAMKLASSFLPHIQSRRIDAQTQEFCIKLFQEAISQEFLQADTTLYSVPSTSKQHPPRAQIRRLFSVLYMLDNEKSSELFEATLLSLIKSDSRIPYSRMHSLVTTVYNQYKRMRRTRPSEELLMTLLRRVTEYADKLRIDRESSRNISVAALVKDWKKFHRRLSENAHVRLLAYYARSGNVEQYERALDDFRSEHPDSVRRRNALWTSIYIHARRGDLDSAQGAFSAVKRELAEYGEEPDLRCWNTLLHAHSRADDLNGALTNLQNLIGFAHLTPDAHSFQPVTELFAKRGDVDGVEEVLEQYDDLSGEPRNTALLGSLITAFVRSNDIETAEKVLYDTVKKVKNDEISGSLTGCFNIVLTSYATARSIDGTKRVYQWMREQKIRLNADSYGALIFALCGHRQVDSAYNIINSAMKESGIEPSGFHYSLIMAGYNRARRPHDALRVREDMMQLNIKGTLGSRTAYVQALAMAEHQASQQAAAEEYSPAEPLEHTLHELQRILQESDGSEVAAKAPQMGLGSSRLTDAELAAGFDYLIMIHGKRRCFEAVEQLFAQYKQLAAERGSDPDALPTKMLAAVMSAYWRAGEYDKVEEGWEMAKENAEAQAAFVQVPQLSKPEQPPVQPGQRVPDALELEPVPDDTEPNDSTQTSVLHPSTSSAKLPRPVPGRRHILTRPLHYYLAALHAQDRHSDLVATVAATLSQGYTLDNRTFNFFIECLCRRSPPLALLAFVLTERFLTPSFPGWNPRSRRLNRLRPQERAEGLQHIRARYLKPGQLMPQYRTLVRLGSVLLEVRRLEALGRRARGRRKVGADGQVVEGEEDLERFVGTVAEIRKRAPKTMFVVQSMPSVPDSLQSRLIRREY